MGNNEFILKSIDLVRGYYYDFINLSLDYDDIYVVWSCKTLQNNKALLSTNVTDGLYFEITYNGDKEEFYFDVYKKVLNKCVSDKCEGV